MGASPWIALIWLIFQTRNAQFTTVNAIKVDGLEGDSAVLECKERVEDYDIVWFESSFSAGHLIAIRLVNGDILFDVNTSWNTSNLQIDERGSLHIRRLDYKQHNRTFYCQSGPWRTQVELTVYPNPTRLTLSNEFAKGGKPVLNVTQGMPVNVNCTPDSSFPDFNFKWALDGRVLRRTHGLQSGVTLKAGVDDHEATLECTAEYLQRGERKIKTQQASLNVLYIDPSARSTISVLQGRNIDLVCNVTGNPPPSFSWWRIHGDQSEELPGNSDIYSMTSLKQPQAGTYECRARNDVGDSTKSVDLIVEYPPEAFVTFNQDLLSLECLADGIPKEFNFLSWKQILGDVTLWQIHSGKRDKNIYRLFLSEDCNAMGLYVCTVANIYGTATAEFFFRPKCKPRFGDGTFKTCIRNKTGVVVPFYAYPEFTSITWRAGSGEIIHAKPNLVVENISVEVVVQGFKTKILGQAVVWDLADDLPGSFTVTITNSVGSSRLRLTFCEDGGLAPLEAALVVTGVFLAVFFIVVFLFGARQRTEGTNKKFIWPWLT